MALTVIIVLCIVLDAAFSAQNCPGLYSCISPFAGPYSRFRRQGLKASGLAQQIDDICSKMEGMKTCKNGEEGSCNVQNTKSAVNGALEILGYFCNEGKADLMKADSSDCAENAYTVSKLLDMVRRCERAAQSQSQLPDDPTKVDNSKECRLDRAVKNCYNTAVVEDCGTSYSAIWSRISIIMGRPLDRSNEIRSECQTGVQA